jgi:hypothetical protein
VIDNQRSVTQDPCDSGAPVSIRYAATLPVAGQLCRERDDGQIARGDGEKSATNGDTQSKRRQKRGNAAAAFKRARHLAGSASCDVCGWHPPIGLLAVRDGRGRQHLAQMLHAHHVVPVACGGADEARNLALLCPTHHAIAHALGQMRLPSKRHRVRAWEGPRDPEALVYEIRLCEVGGDAWLAHIRGGRNEEELIAATRRATIRLERGVA